MESKVVVARADRKPMENIIHPGPHQINRNSRVSVENRMLGDSHPEDIRVEMIYGGLCGTEVHLVETNPGKGSHPLLSTGRDSAGGTNDRARGSW